MENKVRLKKWEVGINSCKRWGGGETGNTKDRRIRGNV